MTRVATILAAVAIGLAAGCTTSGNGGTISEPVAEAPQGDLGQRASAELESALTAGLGECTTEPPLPEAELHALPAARTRDGRPLQLADVAGEYDWSFGFRGGFLRIFPDGSWICDWGPRSDWCRGDALIVEGRLVFETRDSGGRLSGRTAPCTPIWWGDRICLVGDSQIWRLANLANWGTEEDDGRQHALFISLPIIAEQADTPPAGPPLVPLEWETRILQKPIRGKVIDVIHRQIGFVDLGSRDGVFTGMRLQTGYRHRNFSVMVVSTEEDWCKVIPVQWGDSQLALPGGAAVWCDARGSGIAK